LFFSIILLIFRPNFVSILLGWDGLGLVSYCLVIFYENNKSSRAGILTIFSNRIGDVLILLRISLILGFGTTRIFYLELISLSFELKFIFYLILLAAMTKRAQIPFSAWLPAAMAAPTPVSSLVHSSTLVTAGVYLLIRFYNIFEIKYFLFIVSLFTIVISGVGAVFETDLKKIIALSTLSQLGIIIITLSFGLIEISFFHLLRHALFKSLLFLCAGGYIHSLGDFQDSRLVSYIWVIRPVISFFFVVSSLSLCGFPFISGFYSKDLILEYFFINNINFFIIFITLVRIFFTFVYSIRFFYLINTSEESEVNQVFTSDLIGIYIPISLLFIFSFLGGALIVWFFFPLNFIYLRGFFRILVLLIGLLSLWFLFFIDLLFLLVKINISFIYFFSLMWNLPYLSTFFFSDTLKLSFNYLKYLDQGWGEFFGSQGTYKLVMGRSFYIDRSNILRFKNIFFIFLFIYFLFLLF